MVKKESESENKIKIFVYAEGPSEWYAVLQLHKMKLLEGADLAGKSERNNIGRWLRSCGEIKDILTKRFPGDRILLLYDQESDNSPADTARKIAGDTFTFNCVEGYDNIFRGRLDNGTRIVLHVATAPSPDGNRDFDGYVVKLLQKSKDKATQMWFNNYSKEYVKRHCSKNKVKYDQIHGLGIDQIPGLMKKANWDILRSKGIIYAYITALQANRSHVWFTENMIKITPKETLKDVFDSLIAAWDLLAQGDE